MRRCAVALFAVMLLPVGLARAERPVPLQSVRSLPRIVLGYFAISVLNLLALPNPVSLPAPDPDTTPNPQSVPVTVTWTQKSASSNNPWNLTVAAPASFPACPTLAVSDVKVVCDSVSSDNTNGGWTGACAGYTTLSSSGVVVASGMQGNPSNKNITVNLHYELADSWSHVGGSCSLTLTYTVTAN